MRDIVWGHNGCDLSPGSYKRKPPENISDASALAHANRWPSSTYPCLLVKYMTENPERLHLEEGIVALLAIQHAFPCK